jgi:1L-myo-inositol 1-phosphate cytidylyltransferase
VIRHAVILAAGSGVRLGSNMPKGLTQIAGRPMLSWIFTALAECGVETADLIVSAEDGEFESKATGLSRDIQIRLARCPDSQLGNGRSAAFAEQLVSDDRFFLLMSDHLVSVLHLERVAAVSPTTCALGTSPPASWIDIDDATKVVVDSFGLIREIGKQLTRFDGVDTGVFAMTRAIFPALEEARRAGEYSLTAGNQRLCRDGLLRSAPIGELRWYDVDTPVDLAAAEAWLRAGEAR